MNKDNFALTLEIGLGILILINLFIVAVEFTLKNIIFLGFIASLLCVFIYYERTKQTEIENNRG